MLKPVAGAVYYLAGILVKPATKELAQRLIDKGFRLATKGMKDSKVPINKITDSNIVTYITRAIQAAKKLRAPPKLDPKTGRPVSNNPKNLGGSKMTTAGGRGQSELGRRVGLSKLKSRDKVGPKSTSLPKRVPKKPSGGPKPVPKSTTTSSGLAKLGRGTLIGANIMAGLGLAKVGYDAWKNRNGVTDIDVKDIKITRGEKETKAEFNNRLKKLLPKVAPSKPKPSPKVTKEYFGNRRPTGSGISSTTKKKIDETVRKVLIASRKKERKK